MKNLIFRNLVRFYLFTMIWGHLKGKYFLKAIFLAFVYFHEDRNVDVFFKRRSLTCKIHILLKLSLLLKCERSFSYFFLCPMIIRKQKKTPFPAGLLVRKAQEPQ